MSGSSRSHTGDRVLDILKEDITFMPIAYAESGKKYLIPRATIILILVNVLVFYRLDSADTARF